MIQLHSAKWCLALLDTGVTVNVITADYTSMLDLPMGPLSDLR